MGQNHSMVFLNHNHKDIDPTQKGNLQQTSGIFNHIFNGFDPH